MQRRERYPDVEDEGYYKSNRVRFELVERLLFFYLFYDLKIFKQKNYDLDIMFFNNIILDILIFILAAIPLYFAVDFLGGKTSFLNVVLVNLVTGVLYSVLRSWSFFFGGILAFILMLWIYHEVFRLKWFKAFLAWLLQFVFIALFYLLLFFIGLLFGITFFMSMMPWRMF